VSADPAFGADLFLKIGYDYRHESEFYSGLSEKEVAALYVWLEQNFPTGTDPHQDGGAFWAGPRESVAHLTTEDSVVPGEPWQRSKRPDVTRRSVSAS
jgi:hypothetical protein